MGLAPRLADELGEDDDLSLVLAEGVVLPASGAGVVELLTDGGVDLRLGIRVSDFLSSPFSELWTLPAFDGGRTSSCEDLFVMTLLSYGLKASFTSVGLLRAVDLSVLSLADAGDERVTLSTLALDDFLFFSKGEINGFDGGESAPI